MMPVYKGQLKAAKLMLQSHQTIHLQRAGTQGAAHTPTGQPAVRPCLAKVEGLQIEVAGPGSSTFTGACPCSMPCSVHVSK